MSVCAVARRHGLSPEQLFTSRRLARRQQEKASPPIFVPAVIEAEEEPSARRQQPRPRPGERAIELGIGETRCCADPCTGTHAISAPLAQKSD
ncbi:transposase [Sinorhizobium sp. 7-81]|uniref:transposase n=1 Tax=Sinorhizobium sp. 7-81 TaxID=3049087 RepID=UPI0034DE579B